MDRMRADRVFRMIAETAWRTGDPGLLFLDAINAASPTPALGRIEATNPCGEIPLLPFESCNLGSINLGHVVKTEGAEAVVDWDKLASITRAAVRFLDNVIQVSAYPLPEIEKMTHGNRKVGLGVMGFAEMLIRLGLSYHSEEAIQTAGQVMKFIAGQAFEASRELARERGIFPNWQHSVYKTMGVELRNATRTAIAPTGTISIIAGTTAGIEPLFALAYRRRHVLEEQTLLEVNPLFEKYLHQSGVPIEPAVKRIFETGSLKDAPDLPQELKDLFITALEIPPEGHLRIQAAFQAHVENSVSKTINLPRDATVEDIAAIYLQAWKLNLKGITVFRYGSRSAQVLELGLDEEALAFEYGARCDPGECRI